MIKEYPNGDSAEIKGLTVTVKLGDESMSKIRKAVLDEIDTLRDENAKLRELAKAAWGCVKRTVSCDECRIVACGCTLQSAMRELGVEVSDA